MNEAIQEYIAENKAVETYKKAGGKDKYEDSDEFDLWTGEYSHTRFQNFILNRIQGAI
jgi:hypothetical protein